MTAQDRSELEELGAFCDLVEQDVRAAVRRIRALEKELEQAQKERAVAMSVAESILRHRQLEIAATVELLEHRKVSGLVDDRELKLIENVQLSMRGS